MLISRMTDRISTHHPCVRGLWVREYWSNISAPRKCRDEFGIMRDDPTISSKELGAEDKECKEDGRRCHVSDL